MALAPSLFDAPAGAVLSSATDWVTGTLLGSVALSLCVIAVAMVGLMLMTGRLAWRDGVRVLIGCFVLLGAPIIAGGLHGTADQLAPEAAAEAAIIEAPPLLPSGPPANYDPYAGASLRRD